MKLIISGNSKYVKRMYSHLRKEHPSTRKRMTISEAMKHSNKLGAGAKKRKHLSHSNKFKVVMKEYKRGTLHSGSGKIVKSRKQAIAIALSESRKKKFKNN